MKSSVLFISQHLQIQFCRIYLNVGVTGREATLLALLTLEYCELSSLGAVELLAEALSTSTSEVMLAALSNVEIPADRTIQNIN